MKEVWEGMGLPVNECVEIATSSRDDEDVPHDAVLEDRAQREAARAAQRRLRAQFGELGILGFEDWDASA